MSLPRPGRPLIDQLRLSAHAVERFRRRAPDLAGDEPRAQLALLVEREGVVLTRPPHWFLGDAPADGFLIGILGRYVVPVRRARSREVVLAKPWRAATFISRDISAADLRELTGERLAASTLVTDRIARKWIERRRDTAGAADPAHSDPVVLLRNAIADIPPHGQALSWVPERVAGRDQLHVALAEGTLVLVRLRRDEQQPQRFRTATWIPERSRRPLDDS